MKILLLSHKFYPFIGGIEVNSEIFAHEFKKAGHDVTVLTWTKEEGAKTFPFPVIRNPSFVQLLKAHKQADIIFENNPCLQLSWPVFLFGKPHVIALRTWIARMNGKLHWQDRLKYKWLQHADRVIAISEAIRKQTWMDATVIGNPYRSDLFRILPNIQRKPDFVFLGRLVSDKGADIAIEAFHSFCRRKNDTSRRLTIIGDGPEKQTLQQIVTTLSLTNQVNFTGALRGEELVRELNQYKFFIVPSRWQEPFGNVALEGMACGCIPIVSDGGGLPDAVGEAGVIFTRGDTSALAEAIIQVADNQPLVDDLQRKADIHLQHHRPNVVAAKYLSVIEAAKNKKNS